MAGDGGNHLSGGERQRIAIARAILKNSPVVVLDEATAFADPENEVVIQSSISQLVAEKTLIVIAHRLSTIIAADKILVIDKGTVAAQGTHRELQEKSSLYRMLWQAHIGTRDQRDVYKRQVQMTPVTFSFMPPIVALFTGPIFMLYVAKIPKRWALTILGIIGGILLFITGMFWVCLLYTSRCV